MKLAAAAGRPGASVTRARGPRMSVMTFSSNGPGTNCRRPTKPDGFRRVSPQQRQSGVAAARGGFASSERDERLVASLIFSWKFLGDFLEMPGSRRPRPGSSVVSGSTAPNSDEPGGRAKAGVGDARRGVGRGSHLAGPLIVNSPGAKRKMRLGRLATTAAIDHGPERRARPQ
jgi:hypothetical protein